jgi:hypothetical protein
LAQFSNPAVDDRDRVAPARAGVTGASYSLLSGRCLSLPPVGPLDDLDPFVALHQPSPPRHNSKLGRAAVNVNFDARDKRGIVRREKGDRFGYLG